MLYSSSKASGYSIVKKRGKSSLFQKSNALLIVKTMINVMSHLTGAFPPFLLFHRFLKWIKIM